MPNCEAAEENVFRGLRALILFSDTATTAIPLALFLLALSFAHVLSDSRGSFVPPILYNSSLAVIVISLRRGVRSRRPRLLPASPLLAMSRAFQAAMTTRR